MSLLAVGFVFFICLCCSGLCGLGLLGPGELSAQVPDTTPRPPRSLPYTLPALDVRVSRSAVPPERLPYLIVSTIPPSAALSDAIALDAALAGVPGVQVANRFNDAVGERLTVRGMGARAQFGIRGVRVSVDGIPATMPDGQTTLTHLDAGAITGVDVLRGPASALWGNAAGGVIALRTTPLLAENASFHATAGSHGMNRLSAGIGLTPGTSAVHVRATRQEYGGYREHAKSLKQLASASARFTVRDNSFWLAAHAVDYDALNPGSLSFVQMDSARTQANPNNARQQTGEKGWHAQAGGGWERLFGVATVSVSGYGIARDLENPIPPAIIDLKRAAGGLRATVNAPVFGAVLATAGVEAAIQSDSRANFLNDEGERGVATLDQHERVLYAAPFAQAVVPLAAALDALAAVRYDVYRFRARDRLVGDGDPDDSGTRDMSSPSATVGLRARFGPGSLYGNFSTSFQTPTTTELANRPDGAGGFNPLLTPERTAAFEGGGSIAFEGVALDASVYHARVTDALIPFEVPESPGRQFFRNSGVVVNRGVDVAARAGLLRTLDIRGALSLLDARFDEYVIGDDDFSGNRVPGVPRMTAEGSAAWRLAGGSALLSVRHVGRIPVNDANAVNAEEYTLADVTLETPPLRVGRAWATLTGGISNFTDESYSAAVAINAFGGRFYEPGPGRAFHLGIVISTADKPADNPSGLQE